VDQYPKTDILVPGENLGVGSRMLMSRIC